MLRELLIGFLETLITITALYITHRRVTHLFGEKMTFVRGIGKLSIVITIMAIVSISTGVVTGGTCLSWKRSGECSWYEDQATTSIRWFGMFTVVALLSLYKLHSKKEAKENYP